MALHPEPFVDVEVGARRAPSARGGGRVPWVVVLSGLAPVVLVLGVQYAQHLQPPGTYDAVRQTVSTLAARGVENRWVATTTLLVLGVIYVLVAAGLRAVPRLARVVLGIGAVGLIVVALSPQPAHGSSTMHMAAMVTSSIAFAAWPLGLLRDGRIARGSLVAVVAMGAALVWLAVQAWTDGTWLGVAERVLLLVESVWPIRVAVASWRRSTGAAERPAPVEQMTLALALLPLVVFPAGLVAAQAAQPTVDPLSMSLSALAGLAATSRWIMTTTLLLVGLLCVLIAAGLRLVPMPGRLMLGGGGALLGVAALFPQPVGGGSSPVHMIAGGVAWAGFTTWPLALTFSRRIDPGLRRDSAVAVVAILVLLAWFTVELTTSGTWYGVSQRVVFLSLAIWPIRVAVRAVGERRQALPHVEAEMMRSSV
jgi:hypothetical membrane protein